MGLLKDWRFWVGILISGGLLWWFFHDIDLEGLAFGFAQADYGVLAWWIVPLAVSYLLRIWRWKFLLESIHPVKFMNAASGTMIGFMANGILPLRAGELIRPYIVSRNSNYKYSSALATVIFVRILDGLVIMAIFIWMIFLFPFGGMVKIGLAIAVGAIYVTGCLALVLLYYKRDPVAKALSLPARLFGVKVRERVRRFFVDFGDGLHIFNHRGRLWAAIGLSLAIWGAAVLSYVPIIQAMPFAELTPWFAAPFTLAYVCLGVVFPSAPGFLGIFEQFGYLGLTTCAPAIVEIYGEMGKGMVGAFAILLHVTQVLPYIIIGLIFLVREGLSLGELRRRKMGKSRTPDVEALRKMDDETAGE